MISKKSVRFQEWVIKMYDKVGCPEELVALEAAARIVGHDVDTMGEVDPKSLHALIRAAKNLEAAYENKPG